MKWILLLVYGDFEYGIQYLDTCIEILHTCDGVKYLQFGYIPSDILGLTGYGKIWYTECTKRGTLLGVGSVNFFKLSVDIVVEKCYFTRVGRGYSLVKVIWP